jgi:hypothetical protein
MPIIKLTKCQVLVGFLVPPYLTLLLYAVQYLLDYKPLSRINKAVKGEAL